MSDLIALESLVAGFTSEIDQSPCDGCDECGTRCTTGVPMTAWEFAAIEAELVRLPEEEVARVLGQEKRLPIPGTEETYVACRFRDAEHRRCLIYPARPAICRLFGHVEWLPCPISKVPAPVPGAVDLMLRYADAPRKTYEAWREGEEGR